MSTEGGPGKSTKGDSNPDDNMGSTKECAKYGGYIQGE